jgi:hypothetical protein
MLRTKMPASADPLREWFDLGKFEHLLLIYQSRERIEVVVRQRGRVAGEVMA